MPYGGLRTLQKSDERLTLPERRYLGVENEILRDWIRIDEKLDPKTSIYDVDDAQSRYLAAYGTYFSALYRSRVFVSYRQALAGLGEENLNRRGRGEVQRRSAVQ